MYSSIKLIVKSLSANSEKWEGSCYVVSFSSLRAILAVWKKLIIFGISLRILEINLLGVLQKFVDIEIVHQYFLILDI